MSASPHRKYKQYTQNAIQAHPDSYIIEIAKLYKFPQLQISYKKPIAPNTFLTYILQNSNKTSAYDRTFRYQNQTDLQKLP